MSEALMHAKNSLFMQTMWGAMRARCEEGCVETGKGSFKSAM